MIRSSLYDYFSKLSDPRLNRNKILHLPNGIPSHDTINRVFSMLRPDKFEVVFISWVNSLRDNNIDKEVIAIDGKTICGSKDSFHKKSAIHIVSAWANNNQLVPQGGTRFLANARNDRLFQGHMVSGVGSPGRAYTTNPPPNKMNCHSEWIRRYRLRVAACASAEASATR